MQKSDFRKLLSYYLECIEEEDLCSLTFKVSQLNQSFVLGEDGSFLLSSRVTRLPMTDDYFWKRYVASSEQPETLYLGYPIIVHKKTVLPLFFIEVGVKTTTNGFVSLTIGSGECRLNHHLFGRGAQDVECSLNRREELECDISNLHESLTKAFDYLGLKLGDNVESQESIVANDARSRWARNYILFRGGRSAVNEMLKKDILTFLKYPSFIENIAGTALDSLLNCGDPNKIDLDAKPKFTFLNDDQQKAINDALSQKLTVITGPPGTGKSQVVMNLLAICAHNKKTVLFASKNNKAVDVVYDKLRQMLGEDDWILRLGSNDKIQECQENFLAKLSIEQVPPSAMYEINEGLFDVEQKLASNALMRSRLNNLQESLAVCETEIRIYEEKINKTWQCRAQDELSWGEQDDIIKDYVEKNYRKLKKLLNAKVTKSWYRLVLFFMSRWLRKRYIAIIEKNAAGYVDSVKDLLLVFRSDDSFTVLNEVYQQFVFHLRLKKLYSQRVGIEKLLVQLPLAAELKSQNDALIERQIDLYQRKLRASWRSQIQFNRPQLFALFRRYFSAVQDPPQNRVSWKKFSSDFVSLLDDFYVWIVTNLSARKSIPLEAKIFDFVIIDEASQCDILSALPLLYRAKSAIIIGDPNQLSNITLISAKKEKEIAKKHGVNDLLSNWSYRNRSIYDVAEFTLLDANRDPHLLSFHYRCHPDIIGFSNKSIYKNNLTAETDLTYLKSKFHKNELGVFWHDVKGFVPNSPSSAYNQNEVDSIIKLIESWQPFLEGKAVTIGIVTPFKRQVERLNTAVTAKIGRWSKVFISSIVIGTAHRFQGHECDLVIFSPVVASGIKTDLASWVASTEELLNVAVTRARAAFHVVGDKVSCSKAGFLLQELVTYIDDCHRGVKLRSRYESLAEEAVADILSGLNLPFITQVEKASYRLDFIVTTPFGNKINLEVDGRQHFVAEQISYDEIRDQYITDLGYKVVRLHARDVFMRRESIVRRLSQLV